MSKGDFGSLVLIFKYRVIQLNRFSWRDYTRNPNPAATALMSRMHIAPGERSLVSERDAERQRGEQARQRAELAEREAHQLAACLRELGIDPMN